MSRCTLRLVLLSALAGLLLASCTGPGTRFSTARNWELVSYAATPAWVAQRQRRLAEVLADGERATAAEAGAIANWLALLATRTGAPPLAQVEAVNHYVNHAVVFRAELGDAADRDVWQLPREVLRYGGDCEDLALLKLVSLYRLGWSPARLALVIGRFGTGAGARGHALLLATLPGGAQVLLDNVSHLVMSPAEYIADFRPLAVIGVDRFERVVTGTAAADGTLPASAGDVPLGCD